MIHETKWMALLAAAFAAPLWAAQPMGCLIEPDRVAEVGSQVIGVIESMHVERGDRVKKGQVVATLRADVERASVVVANSRAEAQADVQAAAATVSFNQQRLARAEDLFAKKFISQQALDQARAEAEVAVQKLAQARRAAPRVVPRARTGGGAAIAAHDSQPDRRCRGGALSGARRARRGQTARACRQGRSAARTGGRAHRLLREDPGGQYGEGDARAAECATGARARDAGGQGDRRRQQYVPRAARIAQS